MSLDEAALAALDEEAEVQTGVWALRAGCAAPDSVHGLSAATAERWASLGLAGMASVVPFRPLAFTAHGEDIVLSEGGTTAVGTPLGAFSCQSAVCGTARMAHGRHFVEVTCVCKGPGFKGFKVGVVTEDFDPTGGNEASRHYRHWMYSADGHLYTDDSCCSWEGMRAADDGDRVGLLLDLGAGSLVVYLNGEQLGLSVDEGIVGPVLWAVDLGCGGTHSDGRHSDGAKVRLEAQPAP
jgi:hypothetical protein